MRRKGLQDEKKGWVPLSGRYEGVGGLMTQVGMVNSLFPPALLNPTHRETYTVEMVSSVQSLSRVRLFATPWTAARQASLPITSSWSLLKLMSVESVEMVREPQCSLLS